MKRKLRLKRQRLCDRRQQKRQAQSPSESRSEIQSGNPANQMMWVNCPSCDGDGKTWTTIGGNGCGPDYRDISGACEWCKGEGRMSPERFNWRQQLDKVVNDGWGLSVLLGLIFGAILYYFYSAPFALLGGVTAIWALGKTIPVQSAETYKQTNPEPPPLGCPGPLRYQPGEISY